MKKIIVLVSTLGCICLIGANIISLQKVPDQLVLLENIEAIASGEGTAVSSCNTRGSGERQDWFFECDSNTSPEMIYPCPGSKTYGSIGVTSMCTK